MPSVHPFHILVNEDDLSRARDILDQYETMPDDSDDEGYPGPAPSGVCYHAPSCSVFSALRGVPDTGVTDVRTHLRPR